MRGAILAPVLTGITYFLAAYLALTLSEGADGVVTIWPASGVLLAALLWEPRSTFWRHFIGAAIGSVLANRLSGNALPLSIGFTAVNLIESLIAIAFIRRWCGERLSFISLKHVVRFCVACTLAAAASAACAWPISSASALQPLSWFTTDLLGMLLVAPTIVTARAFFRGAARRAEPVRYRLRAALTLLLVATTTMGVFLEAAYPLLFLWLIALLAATYVRGTAGAAIGTILIAVISSTLTAKGYGPLTSIRAVDPARAVLFLQFYYLSMFAAALPLAALLTTRARLMAICADNERMYRLLADHSHDMIVRIGLDGVRRYVSPASRRILGHAPEELIGATPAGAIHAEDRSRVVEICRTLLEGADAPMCVYRQAHADGHYVWLEAVYRLVHDPVSGAPVEFIASVRDVSSRLAAELAVTESNARLKESHRLLTMAEQTAHVGHWRLDGVRKTIHWSDEVFRIHGRAGSLPPRLEEAIEVYHPDDRAKVESAVGAALEHGRAFEFEGRIVRPSGEIRHIVSRGQPELGPDGAVLGVFGVLQDVTQHHEVEQLLEQARTIAEEAARRAIMLSETDELTGVASRRRSLGALDEAIAHARQTATPLAVAIFDIDHFKRVNDLFGHGVGDDVIRKVASTAAGALRPTDLIGRIGGEEFVVVLPGADLGLATMISERVRATIEVAGSVEDGLPKVTVSIGVATLAGQANAAALLHLADTALYDAKASGRNTLRLAA